MNSVKACKFNFETEIFAAPETTQEQVDKAIEEKKKILKTLWFLYVNDSFVEELVKEELEKD